MFYLLVSFFPFVWQKLLFKWQPKTEDTFTHVPPIKQIDSKSLALRLPCMDQVMRWMTTTKDTKAKREREKSKCRIIDNISLLYMHSYSERATDYWWRRLQRNTPFTRDQAMENCVFFTLQAVIHSAPVHLSLDQLQKHSHTQKNNAQWKGAQYSKITTTTAQKKRKKKKPYSWKAFRWGWSTYTAQCHHRRQNNRDPLPCSPSPGRRCERKETSIQLYTTNSSMWINKLWYRHPCAQRSLWWRCI